MKKENSNAKKGTATPKNNSPLVKYFIIFVVGFLTGVAFTVYKSDPVVTQVASSGSGEESDHDHPEDDETQKAILNLEAEVTSDPKNYQAWVRLGHLYYDTQQPEKAIGAYTKSLELHSGDANLLTDLGVMYRRNGQAEKAIDMFNQAIKKDGAHQPARFNKGIVMMFDLDDPQGAISVWEEILKINPEAKTSDGSKLSDFIKKAKEDLAKKS